MLLLQPLKAAWFKQAGVMRAVFFHAALIRIATGCNNG